MCLHPRCSYASPAKHHSQSSSLPNHMLHFPASIPKQMRLCTRDSPMLPQQGIIHIQQAYQTTCFFSHPTYQSRCVSAPQMLLCFPSSASFMINKHTKPHASFPSQHAKADVSMPPSIPKHILFVCQPANLGSRPASIPDYMLLCSTSSTHV